MKKNIFRFIFFLILNALLFCFTSFGYWSFNGEHHDSEGSTSTYINGHYDYSDVIMTEDTSKRVVKMTQDDEYYYFDVTMYISRYFGKGSTGKLGLEAYKSTALAGFNPVVADFSDIYNLYFFNEGYSSGTSSQGSDYDTLWLSKSNNASNTVYYYDWGYRRGTTERRTNNIALHGIGFKGGINKTISKSGETHKNVKFLSNSSTCTSNQYEWVSSNYANIESASFTLKCKVGVAKEDIMYFRYLSFLSNEFLESSGTTSKTFRGYSASVNTSIDLSLYTNCDHIWIPDGEINKLTHKIYCNKCNWHKTENHILEYEYDGIDHNLCFCGYVDKVKYNFLINDDFYNEEEKILDSLSYYDKIEFSHKTGYNFLKYEKYEVRIASLSNLSTTNTMTNLVRLDDCNNLTDITSNFSTIYKAVYNPIKFYIRYHKENNWGAIFDESLMPMQEFTYDVPDYLLNNWSIEGTNLEGWYDSTTYTNKLFNKNELILNATDIDNKIFDVYPRFDELQFIIKYYNGFGVQHGSNPQIIKYFDSTARLTSYIPEERDYQFKGWQYGNLENVTLEQLKTFVNTQGQTLNLYAIYKYNENYNSIPEEGNSPGEHYLGEGPYYIEIPVNNDFNYPLEAFGPIKPLEIKKEEPLNEDSDKEIEYIEESEENISDKKPLKKNDYRYKLKNLSIFEKLRIIIGF